MCPVALTPVHNSPLGVGTAKLWLLLVGVNHYQDSSLPSLQYPALDCQGLGKALLDATAVFPHKEVLIHHDFATHLPGLETIKSSLEQVAATAQPQDTVLFYFSGHGVLEPDTQQAVLCLTDTDQKALLETGLKLQTLLQYLGSCAARQQLVWLDACHSGGMTLRGAKGEQETSPLMNPTSQLVEVLRQRAAQSQGFYALLSCDQTQQSWEFPELGHGVFTYYLMRGLRGEAADAQGLIEVDALYQYVYYQTLRYIDKTNQQIRLINQQRSSRGESHFQSEYPEQTPKRIVEGIGKVILGVSSQMESPQYPRRALVVEGLPVHQTALALSKVLQRSGSFALEYLPCPGRKLSEVRTTIETCLGADRNSSSQANLLGSPSEKTTVLLYLRGHIEEAETGEAWLILGHELRLSRSWLRQVLRRSSMLQQIVVLDCPEASSLSDWIEDFQLNSDRSQCLLAAAATAADPEQFAQALFNSLQAADPQAGLPVASWIAQLQVELAQTQIYLHIWLSGIQGVIDVLPASTTKGNSISETVDLGICPYMGLKAFAEENAQYFHGRDALTQRLIEEFRHSALAVIGASGSGKSSVVQAGLIAQLRQGKQLPGSEQWWIGCLRPGSHPIATLSSCLVDPGTEKEKAYQQLQIEGLLYQGVAGLVRWLRVRPEPMVVLVVDQFEELFTLTDFPERQQFLELLLGAVEHAGDRFKLVLCLRTDFIAPCLEVPKLAAILQEASVLVSPCLSKSDYRQAIAKPAEQVGLEVETGLVEVLLQQLNHSAGDLPLLQFMLAQLWEHRQSGTLTLHAYQQLGGLKGALERQAQAVYESLDSDSQSCARWIFLNLTHLGEGTEDTRRRVHKSELAVAKYPAPLVEKTLQRLTAAKLIIMDREENLSAGQSRTAAESEDPLPDSLAPEVTVEVVHEILIRHWSTLRWWLEENRARLRQQRQLEQSARLWQKSGQQTDFLLRGVRLAEAEELYIKYTDELSELVQQFVEVCLEAQQAEQKQAQQRLRRAQVVAMLIAFLGLIALSLGGFAYRQKLIAQLEKIDAFNASSEALLLSNQQLESLTAGVKAGQQLQQMNPLAPKFLGRDRWRETQMRTASTLQQAVYGTQELNRLEAHNQTVNSVQFRPDGQLLASASDDNTVRLWRRDGTLLATLEPDQPKNGGVDSRITCVAFSQNGQFLAAANSNQTIQLWQLGGQNQIQVVAQKTLRGHQDWVTDLSFSPDGQFLASASRDQTVRLWNLEGTLISTLSGHQGWVNTVRFRPDGETLASAGEDRQIRIWQLNRKTGQARLSKTWNGHRDRVTSVAFSPDGQSLLSADGKGTVKHWNLATGTSQVFAGNDPSFDSQSSQIHSVEFTPDGQRVVSAHANGRIHIWSRDGLLHQIWAGHNAEILALDFSPDGTMFASASADKTIKLWDTHNSLQNWDSGVYSLDFNPINSFSAVLATAGWDGTIKLWHPHRETSRLMQTLPSHQSVISDLAFSPDGAILASASWDKTIKLWQAHNGILLTTLREHTDGVTSLALTSVNHPQGQILASGSEDKTIKLWEVINGQAKLLRTLSDHDDGITSVAFSPNGRLLASGSYDHTVKLWRLDGTLVKTLDRHGLAIARVQFSPNGKTLASASWDNTIQIWQISDQTNGVQIKPIHNFSGHQGGVTSIDFSPDGQFLASGSTDATVKLWHLKNGVLLKTLFGHDDPVQSVSFRPDGQALASGDEKHGIMLWNFDLNHLLQRGCDRLSSYLQTNPNLEDKQRDLCR